MGNIEETTAKNEKINFAQTEIKQQISFQCDQEKINCNVIPSNKINQESATNMQKDITQISSTSFSAAPNNTTTTTSNNSVSYATPKQDIKNAQLSKHSTVNTNTLNGLKTTDKQQENSKFTNESKEKQITVRETGKKDFNTIINNNNNSFGNSSSKTSQQPKHQSRVSSKIQEKILDDTDDNILLNSLNSPQNHEAINNAQQVQQAKNTQKFMETIKTFSQNLIEDTDYKCQLPKQQAQVTRKQHSSMGNYQEKLANFSNKSEKNCLQYNVGNLMQINPFSNNYNTAAKQNYNQQQQLQMSQIPIQIQTPHNRTQTATATEFQTPSTQSIKKPPKPDTYTKHLSKDTSLNDLHTKQLTYRQQHQELQTTQQPCFIKKAMNNQNTDIIENINNNHQIEVDSINDDQYYQQHINSDIKQSHNQRKASNYNTTNNSNCNNTVVAECSPSQEEFIDSPHREQNNRNQDISLIPTADVHHQNRKKRKGKACSNCSSCTYRNQRNCNNGSNNTTNITLQNNNGRNKSLNYLGSHNSTTCINQSSNNSHSHRGIDNPKSNEYNQSRSQSSSGSSCSSQCSSCTECDEHYNLSTQHNHHSHNNTRHYKNKNNLNHVTNTNSFFKNSHEQTQQQLQQQLQQQIPQNYQQQMLQAQQQQPLQSQQQYFLNNIHSPQQVYPPYFNNLMMQTPNIPPNQPGYFQPNFTIAPPPFQSFNLGQSPPFTTQYFPPPTLPLQQLINQNPNFIDQRQSLQSLNKDFMQNRFPIIINNNLMTPEKVDEEQSQQQQQQLYYLQNNQNNNINQQQMKLKTNSTINNQSNSENHFECPSQQLPYDVQKQLLFQQQQHNIRERQPTIQQEQNTTPTIKTIQSEKSRLETSLEEKALPINSQAMKLIGQNQNMQIMKNRSPSMQNSTQILKELNLMANQNRNIMKQMITSEDRNFLEGVDEFPTTSKKPKNQEGSNQKNNQNSFKSPVYDKENNCTVNYCNSTSTPNQNVQKLQNSQSKSQIDQNNYQKTNINQPAFKVSEPQKEANKFTQGNSNQSTFAQNKTLIQKNNLLNVPQNTLNNNGSNSQNNYQISQQAQVSQDSNKKFSQTTSNSIYKKDIISNKTQSKNPLDSIENLVTSEQKIQTNSRTITNPTISDELANGGTNILNNNKNQFQTSNFDSVVSKHFSQATESNYMNINQQQYSEFNNFQEHNDQEVGKTQQQTNNNIPIDSRDINNVNQEGKTLAEFFQEKKKTMAQRFENKKKEGTDEKASFGGVNSNNNGDLYQTSGNSGRTKEDILKQRKEMMEYGKQRRLTSKQQNQNTTDNVGLDKFTMNSQNFEKISKDIKLEVPQSTRNQSSTGKISSVNNEQQIQQSRSPKGKKDPNPELLDRLCLGQKTKMSEKEMHNLTKKHYDNLPEIKEKKDQERKIQQKFESLKERQEKVKLLDEQRRSQFKKVKN